MGLFKKNNRKKGNVILPVVGTIAALTILAGSAVAFSLNSSKLVYKDQKQQTNMDARNILYICAKYFGEQINQNGEAGVSIYKAELKDTFSELEISKKAKAEGTIYYLYYPYTYNADGTPATYLRTYIALTATDAEDDPDSGGQNSISDNLFSEQEKIDEKFNIGNMATLFMQENGLIPKRVTNSNTLSVVDADIDTFDEALTYVSGSGVLEIDNLAFVYWDDAKRQYKTITNEDGTTELDIFYETGVLGGNYYWANNNQVCYLNDGAWLLRDGSKYLWVGDNGSYRQTSDGQGFQNVFELHHKCGTCKTEHYVETSDADTSRSQQVYLCDDDGKIICETDRNGNPVYRNGKLVPKTYTVYRAKQNTRIFETKYEEVNIYKQNYSKEDLAKVMKYKENTTSGVTVTSYDYNKTTDIHTIKYKVGTSGTAKTYTATSQDFGKLFENYIYNLYTSDPKKVFMYKMISDYGLYENDMLIAYFREKSNAMLSWGTLSVSYSDLSYDVVNEQFSMSANGQYLIGSTSKTYSETISSLYDKFFKDKSTFISQMKKYDESGWNRAKELTSASYPEVTTLEISDSMKNDLKAQAKQNAINALASGKNGFSVIGGGWDDTYNITYKDSNYKSGKYQTRVYTATFRGTVQYGINGNWGGQETVNGTATYTVNLGKPTITDDLVYQYGITNGNWPEMKLGSAMTREQLQEYLDYKYIAGATSQYKTTTVKEILGMGGDTNHFDGYKEAAIANALIRSYVNKDPKFLKKITYQNDNGDTITADERPCSVVVRDCYWYTQNDQVGGNFIYVQISFYYSYNDGSMYSDTLGNTDYGRFKIISFNPTAGATYTGKKDANGNDIFTPVTLCNNGNFDVGAPIVAVEAINRDFKEGYGTKEVSANYKEYTHSTAIFSGSLKTKDITSNTKLDNGYSLKGNDYTLNIKNGASLYIDGDFTLNAGSRNYININMQPDTILYINGNLNILYDVSASYLQSIISLFGARSISDCGVIFNCNGAHIIVNGDINYNGFKYYAGNIQSTVGQNCQSHQKDSSADYSTNYRKDHPTDERCLLSGTFLVNGDVNFNKRSESGVNQVYSNPLINATFYVDGIFNMTGLWTNGLYDKCRPNFLFARTITQPEVAWSTVFPTGGMFNDDWCATNGYVFMICEDSIDFSQLNFAAVNIYTPYDMIANNIYANKVSKWNFTEFIDKSAVTLAYCEPEMDLWDLPSILREGMKEIFVYEPGGNGNTSVSDRFPQTDGEVDF